MEIALFSVLPLLVMLVIWGRVRSWSETRPGIVKWPVRLAAAAVIACIYYGGKVMAPVFYPAGSAVHAEVKDAILSRGAVFGSAEKYLPEQFDQVVETVVQAHLAAPETPLVNLAAKADAGKLLLAWWQGVGAADDETLLAARRKSLALDTLLAKDFPAVCAERSRAVGIVSPGDLPSEVKSLSQTVDAAYEEAFGKGQKSRHAVLSEDEGLDLVNATLKGVVQDDDIGALFGEDLSNPSKTCQLRIVAAQAALASPRAAELVRFMVSNGQI